MKMIIRIASTALFLAAPATHLNASHLKSVETGKTPMEEASGTTSSISQRESEALAAVPVEPASFEQAIAALVLENAGDASGADDRWSVLRPAMRAFYIGANAAPIWIDANGPTQKAREAAREIRNAAAYGLDPRAYDLPEFNSETARPALARFELAMTRAVLKYAHHAKAGRIYPGKVGHSLNDPESLEDPRGFLDGLASKSDVAAILRALHSTHPQFVALRKKLAKLRGTHDGVQRAPFPAGPVLRLGESHEHVALLRERLEARKAADGKPNLFDETLKTAVIAFQKTKGLKGDGIVGSGTRRALGGDSNEQQIVRILTNMERWRWLPDNMASDAGIFVWANIPEFRVRIVKGGEVAFSERVIVGKTTNQTPVFSDSMEWIEIHPTWYVPNSIKVADIRPSLLRTTSRVVERYHLKLDCGAYGRDWKKIDWNKVDIRNCSFSQPPGKRSVLGDFKFKFPNAHIVYMHDTPQKNLFQPASRAYSHGCVRIRNPRRMAEILLAHDKGMTSSRIGAILKGPKRLHTENLTRHVPVHMTYFTARIGDDGALRTFRDIYGHDARLAQALTGKGYLLPAPAIAAKRKRAARPTRVVQDGPWANAFTAN